MGLAGKLQSRPSAAGGRQAAATILLAAGAHSSPPLSAAGRPKPSPPSLALEACRPACKRRRSHPPMRCLGSAVRCSCPAC